ncbi:MAG TPA: hypothetical protein VG621_02450 [Candidatus Paceibacterota bacterium]|nr:hypothetical protein [Candidatus Paceibacterota bacterium]
MPRKGEFTTEKIKVCFDQLYEQCKFTILNKELTLKFVDQYRAKLETLDGKKRKTKSIPKSKEGLQIVLTAETDTFFVYVLTTVDWKTGLIKDVDEGWVFMVDKRSPKRICFYNKPLHRTKNYLVNLAAIAEAENNRAQTMPCCKECDTVYTVQLVKLREGKYGYKLDCPNKKFIHKGQTALNFYSGMDPVHKKVLEKSFGDYEKYRDKNEEAGTIRKTSRDIRAKKTFSEPKGVHLVKEYIDRMPEYDYPQ